MNKRQKSYYFGLFAEYYVMIIFFFMGYIPIGRRFKTKFGEIDLIFKKGDCIVAFEVKARSNKHIQVDEAVGKRQLYRISNSLKIFLNKYKRYSKFSMRIDIVLVHKNLGIKHIKNVWDE